MHAGNEGIRVLKRYSVSVHGFGDGLVQARNRTHAHYLVILHLRSVQGETVPFTQPMRIQRLWEVRGHARAGVTKWTAWDENEPTVIESVYSFGGV